MKLVIMFEVEVPGETTAASVLNVLRPSRDAFIAAMSPVGKTKCVAIKPVESGTHAVAKKVGT